MSSVSEPDVQSTLKPSPGHGLTGKVRGKLAHRTRGRLRLQFPRASPAELRQIETDVRALPGVGRTEVHPKTGSMIVHHTAVHDELIGHLADLASHSSLFVLEGLDDPSEGSVQMTDVEHDAAYLVDHSKAGKAVVRYAEHLNRAVKQATRGWVDLRVLLPATAGICALIFVEIESAPLWVPLALFSFQSFNNLHQPHVTTEGEVARSQPTLVAKNPADLIETPPVQLVPPPVQRARKAMKRPSAVHASNEDSA